MRSLPSFFDVSEGIGNFTRSYGACFFYDYLISQTLSYY